jgi:hypothetical protein
MYIRVVIPDTKVINFLIQRKSQVNLRQFEIHPNNKDCFANSKNSLNFALLLIPIIHGYSSILY